MTFSLAALVGPALAGAVAGALGAPAAVAVSIALIGLALPAAWALPAPERPVSTPPPTTSVRADLTAGLRVVARNRRLARATATSVISCVGQGALLTCCPPLGAAVLGGADRGALLLSATAASALVANAALARHPRPPRLDTVLLGGALLLALAPLLAAIGHPPR